MTGMVSSLIVFYLVYLLVGLASWGDIGTTVGVTINVVAILMIILVVK